MIGTSLSKLKGVNTIMGIFLLIIGVGGNFIAETMNCQIQKVLTKNMYAKNLVLLVIIYFSLDFSSSEDKVHPFELAQRSLWIWLFFLVFNRMDIKYSSTIFIFLILILISKNYLVYYENSKDEKDENLQQKINFVEKTSEVSVTIIMITMIVGFSLYLIKQRKHYKDKFSYLNFIFGKTKCASMK